MADIARLTVALYANSAQFVSELNRSRRSSQNWAKSLSKQMAGAAKNMAFSLAGAAAAAAGVGYAIKESLDQIDDMSRQAANLSIAVDRFDDLAYAATLAGYEMDTVADVIKDITVRVQDAAFADSGPLVDFF
ncbi:MAG: hypothetical protein OIF38_16920, partial [Cellvibrionaceae bacterium]|nr:hypothetical protein [Cellvibrionaceae bacterium]